MISDIFNFSIEIDQNIFYYLSYDELLASFQTILFI